MDFITLRPQAFGPNTPPEGQMRLWLGSDGVTLYTQIGNGAIVPLISGGSVTGLTIAAGKSLTVSNTITLTGTDGNTYNLNNLLVPDTGWVAPESAGDKAQGLVNYTAPTFSGSDFVNLAELGDLAAQVVRLTNVLQATQTALVAGLRPNA